MLVPRWSSWLLRALFLSALPVVVAGCASTSPQPAFDAVSRGLESRTGFTLPAPAEDSGAAAASWLAEPLDGDRAARFALAFDPDLRADLESLGVAQADYAQATRLANPTFFASRLRQSPGDGSQRTVGWVIDLLDWIVQPLRSRQAALELEATRMRVGQRLLDEVASARSAFYVALAARQVASRLERMVDLEEAAATLAQRQVDAGNLSELDLAQQRSALYETRAELSRAHLAARVATEVLARAIGVAGDPATLKFPDSLPTPASAEPPLLGLEERAVLTRPDLAAARFAVTALDRALAMRRATRFSPLGVEVGVERERDADGSKLTGPSLSIRLPLFDFGGASIARLRAEKRRAEYQLASAELVVRSEVREAHASSIALRELLTLQRETLLPERLRILDQTLRRYNMMLTGVYDLLQAKRLEIEAEKATIETWKDYWLARVALDRALGGGIAE